MNGWVLIPMLAWVAAAEAGAQQRHTLTRWDVEGMYAQAKATLEDASQLNMEGVPIMLEACVRNGYTPAARLLLAVYEGRYKGLPAKPNEACALARSLAESHATASQNPSWHAFCAEAMLHLARYAERGYGCTPDDAEAYRWYSRAADAGLPEARAEQARLLMLGRGVKRDERAAWQYLHHLAQAHPHTPHIFFYMSSICYSHNARTKAAKLLYMGALQHDADCLNNLASLYESGTVVAKDTAVALSLYRKAAALGNKQASANMQRLAYKEGMAATAPEETPAHTRLANAVRRVVEILPINEHSKERLLLWLRGGRLPIRVNPR
ncbi:MAG: tetratricopeptide repeat protein [Akkermansia sp.]